MAKRFKATTPRTSKGKRATVNKFSVNHASDGEFRGDGLRSFFVYRDLGIKGATGGRVGAHVIRATGPCKGGTGRHRHRLAFQLVYVLKGKVTFHYEGHGDIELSAGSCVHQPPGIVHELVKGSGDLEMLEITLPADFATVDLPAAASPQKHRIATRSRTKGSRATRRRTAKAVAKAA